MNIFYMGISIPVTIIAILMMLVYYVIIARSGCYPAEITGINKGGISSGLGGTSYSFEVKFQYKDRIIQKSTLTSIFLAPFFEKWKLERYRKRYQGKEVHVYFNPDNPEQILIKEHLWKTFLSMGILLAAGIFIFAAGLI